MKDATVVSALMAADGGFFFEDGYGCAGKAMGETPGGCQAYDAPAYDYYAISHLLSFTSYHKRHAHRDEGAGHRG